MAADEHINVTIQRRSKKKAGFEVERRKDGFYYITKVPKSCTKIGVGDRVLEINGTMHQDFKNQTNANDLVDSFRLDVVPGGDANQGDDSEEEYEEMDRSGSKTRSGRKTAPRSKTVESQSRSNEEGSDYGGDWNDGGEMKSGEPEWGDGSFNKKNFNNSAGKLGVKLRKSESWDRQYVSQYEPNDRFMISVNKREEQENDDLGIDLVEFQESELYVSEVNPGPFYETALNRGDRIISINGKKIPGNLNSVDEAMDILYSAQKMTLFVLRPEKNDAGYKWVNEHA